MGLFNGGLFNEKSISFCLEDMQVFCFNVSSLLFNLKVNIAF